MSFKYAKFDRKLFAWLRGIRATNGIATTADAILALGVGKNPTLQRHVSRRFTQLEDRGVLVCTLRGTTRLCRIVAEIPDSLAKQPWRAGISKAVSQHLDATGKRSAPVQASSCSIPAATSDEFLAKGGTIDRLPSHWDKPMTGSKPLGDSFSFDD
jgi:hypothetical protein